MYNVVANERGQPSKEVWKVATERSSHPTTTLKRPRLPKIKERYEEIDDNRSIWECLARAKRNFEEKPDFVNGDKVMLRNPNRLYPSTPSQKKEWCRPFRVQSIRYGRRIVIQDAVMSFADVPKFKL